MKTINRKTVLCFDTFENRKYGIDFLIGLNIPFTYSKHFPVIKVTPKRFIKNHLDLYLPNVKMICSQFDYSHSK